MSTDVPMATVFHVLKDVMGIMIAGTAQMSIAVLVQVVFYLQSVH